MGFGGTKVWRVDITDSYDPRDVGAAATKGTLFRYIPTVGDPTVLIKADEGFSMNWIPLGGSTAVAFPVSAASVANVVLAVAPATIDGVAYTTVLIKNQAAPAENGIYDFNGAGVPLTRNVSWNQASEFPVGREVFVTGGLTQADTFWINDLAVVTLGVDPIQFSQVPVTAFMLRNFSNALTSVVNLNMGGFKILNLTYATRLATGAAVVVVAATDYKVLVDTTDAAAGTVTLPAGTAGMTFRIAGVKAGAFTYTMTPTGGDVFDPSASVLIAAGSVAEYSFLGGVWYQS